MEGGGPGGLGRNTWVKMPREEDGDLPDDEHEHDGKHKPLEPRLVNIGGKATVWMGKVCVSLWISAGGAYNCEG
jgi:5-oxoprolinase (ATP-hydrolysing)